MQLTDAESAKLVGFVGDQVSVGFTNDFALLAQGAGHNEHVGAAHGQVGKHAAGPDCFVVGVSVYCYDIDAVQVFHKDPFRCGMCMVVWLPLSGGTCSLLVFAVPGVNGGVATRPLVQVWVRSGHAGS